MIWVNKWMYKRMEERGKYLFAVEHLLKYRWNEGKNPNSCGLGIWRKKEALKAWKTKDKKDPRHMLTEKQNIQPVIRRKELTASPPPRHWEQSICLLIAESASGLHLLPLPETSTSAPHVKQNNGGRPATLGDRRQQRTVGFTWAELRKEDWLYAFLAVWPWKPTFFMLPLPHVSKRH